VVLVTGATGGIGEACARRFARNGHPLVLLGRREERLARLAADLPVPVHTIAADLRNITAAETTVADLPAPFADIGVLVNNAGVSLGFELSQEADLGAWEEMIDTNVRALVRLTHLVLPGMVRRDRGHIVNIGSPAATHPFPRNNVYGATKAFVRQFSLNLRADLLGTRIRVTLLEPGLCRTELFARRFAADPAKADAVFAGVEPLEPEDVAEAVFWCTSLKPRANVDVIEMMPVAQACGPLILHRAGAAAPTPPRADNPTGTSPEGRN
jgi:3-hydroxy acid dehydrogenase / malonic semialdehyde reductase